MSTDRSSARWSRGTFVGAALVAAGLVSILLAVGTPLLGTTVVGDGVQSGGDVQWAGVVQITVLLVAGVFLGLSGANRLRS